ncbi:endonuclease domain-containing 1 protein-like [Anguilla anguilla]|uniref:DNA/RNA non-specific endonuclease domain-containing protein n=2 Tax=Anguilla anguilla TaxID=7936 RepID=A0A9D3S7X0_ANGAN|nr:endonuclease domain-containing 1 protein-like [Anguilla anguilla]KAG5854981.1 hypothetical protein ANANG_G00043840 [Anguilla anguilla]
MAGLHTAVSAASLLALATWCCHSRADVGDFTPCAYFLYHGSPPKGLLGVPICQRYLNQYRFASLYSRRNRAPWYSAYVFTRPAGKRPKDDWKYEPQLAYAKADGNMVSFPHGKVDQNIVESQAVQLDYFNSSYTHGHLNPSLHHQDPEDRNSTFTLTNVVPQKFGSNSGPWARMEMTVNKLLTKYCKDKAYIVTGTMPYQTEHWLKENRVAIPEYLWSAYCCPNYTKLPENLTNVFPTFAAIGRNDSNSTEEIVPIDWGEKKEFWGYDVRIMPLDTLEMYLRDRFGTFVSVFYNQCSEP